LSYDRGGKTFSHEDWLLAMSGSTRLKPYEKFAEMIDRHWDGIAAYCRRRSRSPSEPGPFVGSGQHDLGRFVEHYPHHLVPAV
jgi:hypothetical protein